jgi:hypothetical protein
VIFLPKCLWGSIKSVTFAKELKAAIEREQSQTCLSYVEREQAQCEALRIQELKS